MNVRKYRFVVILLGALAAGGAIAKPAVTVNSQGGNPLCADGTIGGKPNLICACPGTQGFSMPTCSYCGTGAGAECRYKDQVGTITIQPAARAAPAPSAPER